MKASRPALTRAISALVIAAVALGAAPVTANAVLGGTPAQGDPTVVQIRSQRGLCSAAFWQPQILITAAHCVTQTGNTALIDPASIRLHPPGADTRTGTHPAKVREIYLPAEFVNADQRVSPNDISFLILDQPLGTPAISRLASETDLQRWLQEGRSLTHVGYGEVSPRVLTPIPNRIDQRLEAQRGSSFFTRSTTTSGPCQGDSGSPVVITEGAETILVGVLSGGSGGCLGASINPITVSVLASAYPALIDQSLISVGMTGLPLNVRAVGADRELTVLWERPSLNPNAVAAYDVIDGQGTLVCQVPAGVQQCTIPDRPNGVYDLRVISISTSGYRATSEPTTVIIGPPDAPGAPKVKRQRNDLRISWQVPSANSATLTSFVVKDLRGNVVCRVNANQVDGSRATCKVPLAKIKDPGTALRVVAESSLGRTEPSPRSAKLRT